MQHSSSAKDMADGQRVDRPLTLFFSVGEPSGDLHGANLIRSLTALDPGVNAIGFGGPRMAAAGCQLNADLTRVAIMFILQAVVRLHIFVRHYRDAIRTFRQQPIDAVVLIDFPGFNWWIARAAKRHSIPVFYYGVPQMWAWAPWRVRKLRRLVDYVLCKLPFEAKWFNDRQVDAQFIGHPYFDELSQRTTDIDFATQVRGGKQHLLTILPGSRDREINDNLAGLVEAARLVRSRVPDTAVAIGSFNQSQADQARQLICDRGLDFDVHVDRTADLIAAADACLACSGSVSLELMYHRKPSVILFRVTRWTWILQSIFLRVKYITLVNLFWTKNIKRRGIRTYNPDARDAERVPFPEYLCSSVPADKMAEHITRWMMNQDERRAVVATLDELVRKFGQPGASQRAAAFIVGQLSGNPAERSVGNRAA